MALQNLLHLTRRSALAATIALLAAGAQADEVVIDFDAIPNPNLFGGPFAFPQSVSEDGFTLSESDGQLDVDDSSFVGVTGYSLPNFVRPKSSSAANATLRIEEADGSAFLFLALDGYSFGPVELDGTPLASGHITARGFVNGSLVAEDAFNIASGLSYSNGDPDTGQVVLDPATPFAAVNLLGERIDRLEIEFDGFDTGLNPSPLFYSAADNIRLDTDADVLQTVQTDLLAGQTIPVGSVEITQDPATCLAAVTLKTNYPWCLTEAHLATGDTLGDIPQTKKGQPDPWPIRGQRIPGLRG